MEKRALLIPRPGATATVVQQGYADALRQLGWVVYVCDPKSKLGCESLIEDYGVRFIMTHSKYGVRQLPIQVINDNKVTVLIDALPLNDAGLTIGGPYEMAHEDEPDLAKEIQSVIVHTKIEPHLWSSYMCGWLDGGIDLTHLPVAGNLVKAMPLSFSTVTDVAMVANFNHRESIMQQLIEPLFKRIDLLGYSYQAFGDEVWQLAGLDYSGPLACDKNGAAIVYASAKVCPNVHTKEQVELQAFLNERSFMITLCGGLQVSDNPLATQYLMSHCLVATSTTDYMNKVIESIEDESSRTARIKAGVEYVANNHTYFNRLADIFQIAGFKEYAKEVEQKGSRAAMRHCWEIDAKISAEERGVTYENKAIGTA